MPRKPTLSEILDAVRAGAEVVDAVDNATDGFRSVRSLRRRAADALDKAKKARTKIGRAFWLWRYDVLSDRADRLEGK